jgi:hypothetical protein
MNFDAFASNHLTDGHFVDKPRWECQRHNKVVVVPSQGQML